MADGSLQGLGDLPGGQFESKALDVDETLAQLLASEGFSTVEELAYIELSEIASIQGFDEETAAEIQNRAADYLAAAGTGAALRGARVDSPWDPDLAEAMVRLGRSVMEERLLPHLLADLRPAATTLSRRS